MIPSIVTCVTAFLVCIGILFAAKQSVVDAEKKDEAEAQLKAIRSADEVDKQVNDLPDGAALNELRDKYGR